MVNLRLMVIKFTKKNKIDLNIKYSLLDKLGLLNKYLIFSILFRNNRKNREII
jgi:hypothetical protein